MKTTGFTNKIARSNSYTLIMLGILQMVGTPVFFATPEEPAFWFFNGGITLIILGFLNTISIKYGTKIADIQRLCIVANTIMLIFWITMAYFLWYKFMRYPFSLLPLFVLSAALFLSIRTSYTSKK